MKNGGGVGNGIWLCEIEMEVAFYVIRIACAKARRV